MEIGQSFNYGGRTWVFLGGGPLFEKDRVPVELLCWHPKRPEDKRAVMSHGIDTVLVYAAPLGSAVVAEVLAINHGITPEPAWKAEYVTDRDLMDLEELQKRHLAYQKACKEAHEALQAKLRRHITESEEQIAQAMQLILPPEMAERLHGLEAGLTSMRGQLEDHRESLAAVLRELGIHRSETVVGSDPYRRQQERKNREAQQWLDETLRRR